MKPSRVAVLSALGMLLTSVSVYSLTPPPGSRKTTADISITQDSNDADDRSVKTGGLLGAKDDLAHFTTGKTLMVEGRVGHAKIAQNDQGETFVMLEVRGNGDGAARVAAPVNLAIVMDRSGSMKGGRLSNAIQGALMAVSHLNEGDTVSVVTFDTRTTVSVPPTVISSFTRDRVNAEIQRIALGGDTCISCGLEDAMAQLSVTRGKVNKMILLSDGDANHGVRDVGGFRLMAQRAREQGIAVTTIGVDVDYNEKIMAAIASESNGRHFFVENASALARVFETEAESATETIASSAEATIDLAPGVELERVFDRSFRRSGSRVIVPLGSFTKDEVKTVLLKVRVPSQSTGETPVADVELGFRDLLANRDGRCTGKLGVEIMSDRADATEIDAVVANRVERAETSNTLKTANDLFEQGRFEEARKKLEDRGQSLLRAAQSAKTRAPAAKAADIDKDFEAQVAAVNAANNDFNGGFATPPAAVAATAEPGAPAVAAAPKPAPVSQESRAGKVAVKRNVERFEAMGF